MQVYIHMSKGFIFLALALCLILLPTMFLSFRPVCRRLNKIDFIFSFLSIVIGADVELQFAYHGAEAQLLPLGLETPLIAFAAADHYGQELGVCPEVVCCNQLCELPWGSTTE